MKISNHTILWQRLDFPGHEIGRLMHRKNGWELSGTAVFVYETIPCIMNFMVVCDENWQTRSANVKGTIGNQDIDLNISVDSEQKWRMNGQEYPIVSGCIDIDLGFSPTTNLLPIRRLSLAVGEAAEVKAAWLPFPSLTFEPLSQIYSREDENIYQYESGGGSFVRLLKVNETGFVTEYPGLWRAESIDVNDIRI